MSLLLLKQTTKIRFSFMFKILNERGFQTELKKIALGFAFI